MTPRAEWFAQPVPPLGAITSEGIKNPLGRPSFDRLTVLVREAAQNSWDARPDGEDGGVHFFLDLKSVPSSGVWRDALLGSAPDGEHLPLRPLFEEERVDVLFVSDRGTKGLGGPTRGGRDPGARKDYLSFVLNVGVPRDREGGGGTFGYGKAILYNCSRAQAILVYTRTSGDARYAAESRFIGIGLGSNHVRDGREYTGRFWWGLPEGDEHVEPLRGAEADHLAEQLGFPPFEAGQTGTTIAILGSDLDGRTLDEQGERLAQAIGWHLWPKMAAAEMTFGVEVEGRALTIPSPDNNAIIGHFASVFSGLADGTPIVHHGRHLGHLRIETRFAPRPVIDEVGREAGLVEGVHHVCLMRSANLVVEYLRGDPLPDEHLWYAGVFKVDGDSDCDAAFAAAEPPTHDTWEPAQLEPDQRRMVSHALRRVKTDLRAHVTPSSKDVGSAGADTGLGALSADLGGLLAPSPGDGASVASGEAPQSPRTKAAIQLSGDARWEREGGQDVLVQDFEYSGSRRCTVDAALRIQLWGGAGESDAPEGSDTPSLLHWRRPDGSTVAPGPLSLEKTDDGRWSAVVVPVPDTVTSIVVREARRSGR